MLPRTARLAALVPLAALAAAPLRAQEPVPDTLPRVRLDTLAVRVLRTPVPLLRAPFAVSVAGEDEVRRARPGLALDEALGAIPGVQVDNRHNYALGERISIRGFGARAQFGVRGVRVLVDGIPATLPDGQTTLNHVDLGWLERAEVVRGPASALWGNASGGVVHLATAAPPEVPLGTEARVVSGGDGLLRVQGAVGGRSGGWSYRAGATRLRYDGYREHSRADNTLASARLARRGDRSELRLTLNAVRYDALNPGSLSDSLLRMDRRRAFARNVAQRTGERGRQAQAGLAWRRETGAGTLELSGYGVARGIDNPIPSTIIDLERRGGGVRAAWSAERPLGAGALRWTAGAEAEAQRDLRRNFANAGGERGAPELDQRERVTGTAAFAQAALPLAGRWEALGALRYDRVRFAVRDRLPAAPDNPDDSGARTMDAWSPTLGLTFAAAPAMSLYANVATAFETPTTTELANRPDRAGGFNPELEPQRTVSWEAGAKGRLGGRGGWELAGYRARVRDALIPFEVEGAQGRQFFRNAGAARHRGVEAGVTVEPTAGIAARLAYAWTDARFTDHTAGGETLDGNRVPGIAPHTVDARLSWESPAGGFAEVEVRRASALSVDDANRFRSPAHTLTDLRAGWEGARLGRVRATPFAGVTNLFDVRYNASVVVNAFGGRFYEPGPGRTLYLGIEAGLGAR
jgi:iron complex outermembrane receptor protein